MALTLDLQIVAPQYPIPTRQQFKIWVTAALQSHPKKNELVIRIVDTVESAELNQTYRHKQGPTNVLSFPFSAPPGVAAELLGDIIICAPLVQQEASAANKPLMDHWAHLVVHGVLHLLGYDHVNDQDATVMENLETKILAQLGFPDPYQE